MPRIPVKYLPALLLVIMTLFLLTEVQAQDFDFKGQISAWGTGRRIIGKWNNDAGIRYIPQFNYSYSIGEDKILNAEMMLNAYYSTDLSSDNHDARLYRAIIRYTTPQSEIQAGLQKINFGPAQLLRALMWFDKVDPRDPLKLTDGVYALRYKYSFMDNSNIWLWGLYGNKDPKGFEQFQSSKNMPEFGGRLQMPVPAGELAATIHTRQADAGTFNYRENRFALDGRWDIGIGLWFESVLQNAITDMLPYKWNKVVTLGGDYTFPLGNGIYFLAEHMLSDASDKILTSNTSSQISAIMLTYPLGVLDNLAVQQYYNWQDKRLYQYYQWQRTYDNFIINLGLFHYPENGQGMFSSSKNIPAAGYGLQLILVYNY